MIASGGGGLHAAQHQHAGAGLGLRQPSGKAARTDGNGGDAATVMAVPSPITKVEATPIQNRPCASAKTSTMMAPEQGRKPTATIAAEPALPANAGRRVRPAPAHGRGPRHGLVSRRGHDRELAWCVCVTMAVVVHASWP